MKRETESQKVEDMTVEEMCAEADHCLVTQWGVDALDMLIAMGNFYGGDEIIVERYMETNPQFGAVLNRYLLATYDYLEALKQYLDFDADKEWHKQQDEKKREKVKQVSN